VSRGFEEGRAKLATAELPRGVTQKPGGPKKRESREGEKPREGWPGWRQSGLAFRLELWRAAEEAFEVEPVKLKRGRDRDPGRKEKNPEEGKAQEGRGP
jgi:hypothetical protein